jgi:hypothetical protein
MLNSVNLFCDLFLKTFLSKQKRHEALSLHVFSPHNYIELVRAILGIPEPRSFTSLQNSIVLITND